METELWRGEFVGGTLKLLMPLVLLQQVPVMVSLTSSVMPSTHVSNSPDTLQSGIFLVRPSKQNPGQCSHWNVVFFRKTIAVEKQILHGVLTKASQISWLKLDLYRDGKPV